MTEKEKAAQGLLYDGNYDKDMELERLACKAKCHEYNHLSPLEKEKRTAIIRELFIRTPENFLIEQPFVCDYGYNIEIGDHFYSNHNLIILDAAKVTIGKYVFIAPNCGIYTAGHALDSEQRNRGLEYAYPIVIEDNVWIGGNVVILPGVTIGHDSVIGAGSVVNRDIPRGVVAAGNPCKPIRPITQADKDKYKRPEEL